MTSGAAWNTRPFRPEAMQTAPEAARRSGLSLTEWLNSAVLDTAADVGICTSRRGFGADGPEDDANTIIGERLDELAHRIGGLMKRDQESDAGGPDSTSNRSGPGIATSLHAVEAGPASIVRELVAQRRGPARRLADVIRDLNSRLSPPGAIAPASGDIAGYHAPADRALGRADERGANPHDPPAGLSSALAELSGRRRELGPEIAGAPDFSRLEEQLRHVTEQIKTLRRPDPAADAGATCNAD